MAARPLGVRSARLAWLVVWGSLAYFAVQSANRTAQWLHEMLSGMASGRLAGFAGATAALAIVVALVIWVVGENFGGILTGSANDPDSGPLLVLLAIACWPRLPHVCSPVVRRTGC